MRHDSKDMNGVFFSFLFTAMIRLIFSVFTSLLHSTALHCEGVMG
jgi:hypothetical protein